MLDLDGKRALVTGGASGIGAEVVRQLQARGVRVAVLDLDISDAKGDVNLRCDVAIPADVETSVASAAAELGGLELAFVNAGVAGLGDVLDLPVDEWDRIMNVNLRGAFLTLQHVGRAIEASGGGAIVVTASTSAVVADAGYIYYGASKAALVHLVRGAAQELGPKGIRVNAVGPGPTRTPMQADSPEFHQKRTVRRTPLGRLGEPIDIAEAVIALFQLEWVTGQLLVADGGFSLYSPSGMDPEPS